MNEYGRRIVVDFGFDRTLAETIRALQDEGLDLMTRFDVREYLSHRLQHDFRRYVLLQAAAPQLMLDALRQDLDVGPILPVTIAIYELADGETAIQVAEPFAPSVAESAWREAAPELARLAEEESELAARALARLQHLAAGRAAAVS